MSKIDLNTCFPEPAKGGIRRGPLPKQSEFISQVLDAAGPKYLAYFGGVGSGKSLILCVSMIAQGVIHGGEYVIARQFMPELRRTTMKTFLDVLPPELLVEHRVADAEVRIRSASGKPAVFYFVGLDDPGKLRSLNLSGFGVDEASQVSEESFLLLQSRLRNSGLRKGLLVGNPAGHNWIYHYFVKKDLFKTEAAKKAFSLILAPSTENVHLPDGYVQSMFDTYSPERVQREIYGSFDAFEGQVYSEFRRDLHVIAPFAIPAEWTRIIGIDHGYRNPSCWLWGAVDYDENIYIYREFYEREWLIEQIVKGNRSKNGPGVVALSGKEKISLAVIDPSTRARRGTTGLSDYDTYVEHLPSGFPLNLANNDKTPGIDRVKTYFKPDATGKPKLYIFNTCSNLIDELAKYRYKELAPSQMGNANEKEEPVKVDDHAVDALRYLIMTRPEPPKNVDEVWKRIKYNSLEGSLYRDLQRVKNPPINKDPFDF